MKLYKITVLVFFSLFGCKSENNTAIEDIKIEEKALDKDKIQVEIHSRVNTTNSEIKEIADLWINYLNSDPDRISNNPYWNEQEKKLYKDFDLSRSLLYQFPSEQLLRTFNPKILSIEKEGEHYAIKTIYSSSGLEGEYQKSDPWSIQKIYAILENNEWRLKNSLPIITADWNKRTVGKITFIFPTHHKFNLELAEKANHFCNQITAEFHFPESGPFDFYITHSGDEMGRLLNFDFFFAGYTTGIGYNDKRILMSGLGSEYYPHEFIHLIVPKSDRHSLIEEGFATWKGGLGTKSFEESARLFANELADNDDVTFSDILNKKWGWQYAAFYTTGAILCHSVYQKGGVMLVNNLLMLPNDNERLIDNLCVLLKIEKHEFENFWRNEVLKFKDK